METVLNKRIRQGLWGLGWIIGVYGVYDGQLIAENVGFIVMGVVGLYFHRDLSNDFIELYPTTNKTFIKLMTLLAASAGLLFGLTGLVKPFM